MYTIVPVVYKSHTKVHIVHKSNVNILIVYTFRVSVDVVYRATTRFQSLSCPGTQAPYRLETVTTFTFDTVQAWSWGTIALIEAFTRAVLPFSKLN